MKPLGLSLLILAGLAASGCYHPPDSSEPSPAPSGIAAPTGHGPAALPSPRALEQSGSATKEAAPSAGESESASRSPESEAAQVSPAKSQETPAKGRKKFPHISKPVVAIEGERGTIYIELRPDKAPKTTENFLKLVKKGFYNGLRWHRREEGFVIQGGDPLSKKPDWQRQPLGSGDVGYTVEGEFSLPHERGTVAMARTGDEINPERRSSGCQFYICLQAAPFLDGAYSAFGKVIQGMDIADQIQIGDVMKKVYVLQE